MRVDGDVEPFLGHGRNQGVEALAKGGGEGVRLGQLGQQRPAEVALSVGDPEALAQGIQGSSAVSSRRKRV